MQKPVVGHDSPTVTAAATNTADDHVVPLKEKILPFPSPALQNVADGQDMVVSRSLSTAVPVDHEEPLNVNA